MSEKTIERIILLHRDQTWKMESLCSRHSMQILVWDICVYESKVYYRDSSKDHSFVKDRRKAVPILDGFMTSSGSFKFSLGGGSEDCYGLHVRSNSEARELLWLFDWVYEVAAEHMPGWDPEAFR